MGMRECMRDVPGEVSGAANFHEMGGELCCECDREMWELRGELGGGGGRNWSGDGGWAQRWSAGVIDCCSWVEGQEAGGRWKGLEGNGRPGSHRSEGFRATPSPVMLLLRGRFVPLSSLRARFLVLARRRSVDDASFGGWSSGGRVLISVALKEL
jgi:hypothetical protein